mmetsp:Transcript_34674/g.87177  ORF Transcript_34674/g.87177 Transcript_34674/m.87177 type:complete len:250 (-) Transcript_34674:1652-2401(-)
MRVLRRMLPGAVPSEEQQSRAARAAASWALPVRRVSVSPTAPRGRSSSRRRSSSSRRPSIRGRSPPPLASPSFCVRAARVLQTPCPRRRDTVIDSKALSARHLAPLVWRPVSSAALCSRARLPGRLFPSRVSAPLNTRNALVPSAPIWHAAHRRTRHCRPDLASVHRRWPRKPPHATALVAAVSWPARRTVRRQDSAVFAVACRRSAHAANRSTASARYQRAAVAWWPRCPRSRAAPTGSRVSVRSSPM